MQDSKKSSTDIISHLIGYKSFSGYDPAEFDCWLKKLTQRGALRSSQAARRAQEHLLAQRQ